jgi:hypothetical protein
MVRPVPQADEARTDQYALNPDLEGRNRRRLGHCTIHHPLACLNVVPPPLPTLCHARSTLRLVCLEPCCIADLTN